MKAEVYYIVYVKQYTSLSGKIWEIGDVREMQAYQRNSSFDEIVVRFQSREDAENYSKKLLKKS